MDVFAAVLASKQATAGQSLMYAKQRYFATLGVPGVYDGKALEEATFYGLPMYRVSTSGGLGAAALPPADPSGGGTVARTSFDVHPAFHRNDTDRGTYWTADGRDPIASHFRPLQPRTDLDVTPTDGARVHGALITTLASTDVGGIDPVLSRPTLDLSANEPELGERDFAFPTSLQRTEEFSAADGRHTTLNLAAGQFLSDLNDPTGRGTQRLFTRIAGDVLRSTSTDFDPPRITDVGSVVANGRVSFDVTTPDSDVASGLALYLDGSGNWHSAQLTVNNGHATGSGDLPGGAQGAGVAFVQLVDRAGNVGVGTDKGRPYSLTPESSDESGPTIVASPAPDADGIVGGPVTLSLEGFNRGTTYNLDGGLDQPYEQPITVTSPGAHTFSATDGFFGGTSRLVFIIKPSIAPPSLTRTVPASPSNDDQPKVQGTAPGAATVQIFTTADCSGTPATQGTADAFAGSGIAVHVAHDAVTTLHATATDAAGNRSGCSTDALTYTEDSTPPQTTDNYPLLGLLLGRPYTGTATDNLSGVSAVEVVFQPLLGKTTRLQATLTCTPDRRTCTWSAKLPPPLASAVTVTAVDAAGNRDPTPVRSTIIL
jgi:hypothetical protein